jgi:hypothetical protein
MNHFIQALTDTAPATWIALGALAVSMAALIVSARRFSFDTRLAGAKKATELRSVLLDMRRTAEQTKNMVENLAKSSPSVEELLAALAKTLSRFCEDLDAVLKQKDLVTLTRETAIELEKSTAEVDDSSKRLAAMIAELHRATEPLQREAPLSISSTTRPPPCSDPKRTQADTRSTPPQAVKGAKPS